MSSKRTSVPILVMNMSQIWWLLNRVTNVARILRDVSAARTIHVRNYRREDVDDCFHRPGIFLRVEFEVVEDHDLYSNSTDVVKGEINRQEPALHHKDWI